LLSRELPEREGAPLRVRLLGEDLIAFRDRDGRVGLLGEHCAYRGASLYLAAPIHGDLPSETAR
jgi:phthalate 4,5-dioxygenase